MLRNLCLTATCLLMGSSAAFASTFTYTSAPLTVTSEGGNGAKQVEVSFSAAAAPAPGRCVVTQTLKKYADRAHTIKSLKTAGYVLTKNVIQDSGGNERTVKMTYATVCLGKDGKTVTGQYQVYFTYTAGLVYGWLIANNLAYTVPGDDVELDLYFGGEVPQVYSNTSDTQGTWTITP
jgi:hypothetical protein